ncbi:MAG: tRNA uridine-5-carboxymethylaminomethyl(34) synthesis GTPase MnmE [Candidatus Didemnitutus sp.]|nr:tRNA uridine-5-carboxymethylaminomethyl(34) synthesis GTPase MnmE [Candidatus Didemnitutus sp.]
MGSLHDTIAALATPAGTAAIAVLRASGPEVPALVRAIFGALPEPRVVRHADYRDVGGELLDDVLFTFFAAPNSYTGEDTLEVSCHGNPFIAQKILEDLLARGCRAAEAGEFTKRAFLAGRMDLSQAEAVMDLIHARSERALAAANRQLRGSLGRRMEELNTLLLSILAVIEVYIDFPEEDLPDENRAALVSQLKDLRAKTQRLAATNHYGQILRDGIRTVIIGEPNAGKSSLLNRLVGRERALVSPEPGTTRDYIEETIALGQHALRLVDTAGLNMQPGALERRGIEKTIEQAGEADLFLWVVDASSTTPPSLPVHLRDRVSAANTITVLNKIDLAPYSAADAVAKTSLPNPVAVSALRGDGMECLAIALEGRAESFRTEVGEDWVAINARHADALGRAGQAIEAALASLTVGAGSELVSSHLRDSLSAFGEISGRIDNERMLDVLFSSFCIGK